MAHDAATVAMVQGLLDMGIPLDQIPAGQSPDGTPGNLINPDNRAYAITICNIACIILGLTFVGIRLFTRIRIVKNVGWDDYCTIVALVCWIPATALCQYATEWGAGTHIWNVSLAFLYPNLLRTFTTIAIMYSLTMLFAKVSILLLYRRLFPIANFNGRWWFVFLFTVGYSTAGALVSLFQCRPVRSTWTLMVVPEYCVDQGNFYTANAVLNIISDLMILALPIPIVWGLNTTLRKKIVLTVMFAMGSVSCVVSILRLRSIVVLYRPGYMDVTWGLVEVITWSQAELAAAMVCTCAPCLRPFFERFTPSFFTGISSNKQSGSHGVAGKYVRAADSNKWAGAAAVERSGDIEMGNSIKKEVEIGIHRVARSASQDSILDHHERHRV